MQYNNELLTGIFLLASVITYAYGQDASENAIPGESATSQASAPEACRGVPLAIRASKGTFNSPGFERGAYPNNANCRWMIVVTSGQAQLYFNSFNVEASRSCLFDAVRVHDGPTTADPVIGTYCGSNGPAPIVGSTNTLTVVFTTDFIGQASGFNATFASSDLVGAPIDACSGVAASLRGIQGAFVSPDYLEGSYPNNALCVWSITVPAGRVRLQFTDFDLEGMAEGGGCRDVVIIRDGLSVSGLRLGTACGSGTPNEVISSSNSLTVIFSSNSQLVKRGFRAEYYQLESSDVGSGLLGCNGQIFRQNQLSGLFTSPGFVYGSYPNAYTCRFQITVPRGLARLQFLNFNLEQSEGCTNDYLEIYDGVIPDADSLIGRYCGTNVPRQGVVGSSNSFFVIFRSSAAVTSTGFAALYFTDRTSSTAFGQAITSGQTVPQISQPPQPAPSIPGNQQQQQQQQQQQSVTVPSGSNVTLIERGLEQLCLAAHNKVRERHQSTGPLVYDRGLAQGAQEWARVLAATNTFRHSSINGLGENLFYGSTSVEGFRFKPAQAVFQWYSEYKDYNYNTASAIPGRNLTDVGHFTQVVWRNSLRLGCGMATIRRNNNEETYIVARYNPPGNFLGLFGINVLPLQPGVRAPASYRELEPDNANFL